MRYWGYFAAKLVVAGGALYGLLALLNWAWPPVPRLDPRIYTYIPPRFGWELGFTLAGLVWFLMCTATMYFIIWDQRYHCRVCLRHLRMPTQTGPRSRTLQFGRPRTADNRA